jgi:hypothetical protein
MDSKSGLLCVQSWNGQKHLKISNMIPRLFQYTPGWQPCRSDRIDSGDSLLSNHHISVFSCPRKSGSSGEDDMVLDELLKGEDHKNKDIPECMGDNDSGQLFLFEIEPSPKEPTDGRRNEKHQVSRPDMNKTIEC